MDTAKRLPLHKVFVRADEHGCFDPNGNHVIPLLRVKVTTDRKGLWHIGLPDPPGEPGEIDAYTKAQADGRFATKAQGDKADSAVQREDVVNSLDNPSVTLPAAAATVMELKQLIDQLSIEGGGLPTTITSKSLKISGTDFTLQIELKPTHLTALGMVSDVATQLANIQDVAFSGSYLDLTDKPVLLTTGDVLTIVDAVLQGSNSGYDLGDTAPDPATCIAWLPKITK